MKYIGIVAGIVVFVCMSPLVFAADVIQLSHDLPEGTPQHLGSLRFKELVEKKSDGALMVEIFPKGQMGSDIETVELLQIGALQASLVPTAKLSEFAPALQVVDLPFLFPSKDVCYCVLDSDVGDKLLADLEAVGIQGVAFWESGFKQLTANKPIRAPEDYQGMMNLNNLNGPSTAPIRKESILGTSFNIQR